MNENNIKNIIYEINPSINVIDFKEILFKYNFNSYDEVYNFINIYKNQNKNEIVYLLNDCNASNLFFDYLNRFKKNIQLIIHYNNEIYYLKHIFPLKIEKIIKGDECCICYVNKHLRFCNQCANSICYKCVLNIKKCPQCRNT